MDQKISLIKYAAFFGSIQIFNFLKNEGVKLESSLLIYAIHSNNAELIHTLEDDYDESFKKCFFESIKCHHNDLALHFLENYLGKNVENSNTTLVQCLRYYNFSFLKNEKINESSFCHLCHYDYFSFVSTLLTSMDVDINCKLIYKFYRSISFKIMFLDKI